MTKLTDTQLIVLSSAAKHGDGLATRPANLNVTAAAKVAASLVTKGLVREIRAKADAPVWHENEDGRFALKITRAGREAIGVDEQETQDAAPASAEAAPLRSKKSGSKPPTKNDAGTISSAKKVVAEPGSKQAESAPGAIRAGSKQAKIIALMSGPQGATLSELVEATDWLPHTTRAALTGLRKRGLVVERVKDEGRGSVYRIKFEPTARAAA